MLGWINDCMESLVIAKFGIDAWRTVKQKAGFDIKDGEILKLEHYTDQSTYDLLDAASDETGMTVDQLLEAFGAHFVSYISMEGYENLLRCQGSTLKDWMNNINAIHQHLQTTFPKKMIMPEFWCEQETTDGSLLLHYHSKRGSHLAPVVVGLVTEAARVQFDLDIVMDKSTTQGENNAKFTTWQVKTRDEKDLYKLTAKQSHSSSSTVEEKEGMTDPASPATRSRSSNLNQSSPQILKCPMTGMIVEMPPPSSSSETPTPPTHKDHGAPTTTSLLGGKSLNSLDHPQSDEEGYTEEESLTAPTSGDLLEQELKSREGDEEDDYQEHHFASSPLPPPPQQRGTLSVRVTKKLFPYHVMIDGDFIITQVGNDLPRLLQTKESDLLGKHVQDILFISMPLNCQWTWSWLRKLEDQDFGVEPIDDDTCGNLRFKASTVMVSDFPPEAMVTLNPDAKNLKELRDMDLTVSDLPIHGSHREAVFLREHLSSQMNQALKMEKLSKSLAREKTLLESLLPRHVAEGLRKGRSMEPRLHNHVTMFFSDVKGFTSICSQIYPWEVVAMLNRLYGMMDFLASKFNIFKVETIGDAYVCASGLPDSDPNHAQNVANFALAVQHCCQFIVSPVDHITPIQIRVGIHTGPCASGIVGVTNPRYCVFGDTVNTTARHESTGEAGRIHCSQQTRDALLSTTTSSSSTDVFQLASHGFVEMKGKGSLPTYWLEPGAAHPLSQLDYVAALELEVQALFHEQADEAAASAPSSPSPSRLMTATHPDPEDEDDTEIETVTTRTPLNQAPQQQQQERSSNNKCPYHHHHHSTTDKLTSKPSSGGAIVTPSPKRSSSSSLPKKKTTTPPTPRLPVVSDELYFL